MRISIPTIILLASLLLASLPVQAALKSTSNTPNASFNPNQDRKDIELPMPNGLKLILRAVPVRVRNALDDRTFTMGVNSLSEGRGFYERNVNAHIAAPFTQKNLPNSFNSRLDSEQGKNFCYYFIGKYELTNAQWYAVMGGTPSENESGDKASHPKANISWYDIQNFLEKYNLWLLANAPSSLPLIEGSPAFLRLPTETEWEYAARGGNISPEEGEEDFPLNGKKIPDYAIFGRTYTNSMPIGTKNPNRLGIYDMAGNIAELVQTPFRFSIVERNRQGKLESRLHGSEGGLVIKGGSFLSSNEEDVYPGSRAEARMFSKTDNGGYEPYKTRFLGARLVLANINVPGSIKTKELEAAENSIGGLDEQPAKNLKQSELSQSHKAQNSSQVAPQKDATIHVRQDGDLLEEIDRIYASASSGEMRKNLQQYKELIKTTQSADLKKKEDDLKESIRASIYKTVHIVSCGYQCFMTDYLIRQKRAKKHMANEKHPENDLSQEESELIDPKLEGLKFVTNDYMRSLKEIANHPKDEVKKLFESLRQEYSGTDRMSVNIQTSSRVFEKEVNEVRERGRGAISREQIWKDFFSGFQIEQTRKVIERYFKVSLASD